MQFFPALYDSLSGSFSLCFQTTSTHVFPVEEDTVSQLYKQEVKLHCSKFYFLCL